MHRELGRVRRSLPVYSIFVLAFVFVVVSQTGAFAQSSASDQEQFNISFEERASFYLDQRSKAFFKQMAAKEKLLLQMIQNISAEIRNRGEKAIDDDAAGFHALYGDLDRMATEYASELDNVVALLEEINDLKALMEKQKRYGMADQFADLRDSLLTVLDNRQLHKLLPATASHVSNLIDEFNLEMKYFVDLYKKMESMERAAQDAGDTELLQRIRQQKTQVINYIELSDPETADSLKLTLSKSYVQEVDKLLQVLDELTLQQKKILKTDPEYATELEMTRRSMLSSLDGRVLKMLGYENPAAPQGPTLSEIFDEWRKTRIAQYEAKYAEYYFMKHSLLESATTRQKSRMLERDLTDALLNYSDGEYALAEIQLEKVIDDYSGSFSNFEAVYFYLAEARYAQRHYDQAMRSYATLMQKYPKTRFRDDIYLRFLTLTQKFDRRSEFAKYYRDFLGFEPIQNVHLSNRVHYMAGFYFMKQKKFKDAEQALAQIDTTSRYFLPAQYLAGVLKANRGDYEAAIRMMLSVAQTAKQPWKNTDMTMLRNQAYLKLGYLHYERGEYANAIRYFDRVSKGVEERDKVLIGLAWTRLMKGENEAAIAAVDDLFRDFLASDYTYEALVLAAHCRRLMNRPRDAMRNLRYVAEARGMLEVGNEYNKERRKLLDQLDELERMEETVVNKQDRRLYEIISEIKHQLQESLLHLGPDGKIKNRVVSEFDSERETVLEQVKALEEIIKAAREQGNKTVERDATIRRQRLLTALEKYQPRSTAESVSYLLQYPLAARENSAKYRQEALTGLMRDIKLEKRRLMKTVQQAQALAASNPRESLSIDLVAVEDDLAEIDNRMERLELWLSENKVEKVETNFNHWADFSGFGMSDIVKGEIQDDSEKIYSYSKNLTYIGDLIESHKNELEARVARLEAAMKKKQEEIEAEKRRKHRLELEKQFKQGYFDTSTSELPDAGNAKQHNERQ